MLKLVAHQPREQRVAFDVVRRDRVEEQLRSLVDEPYSDANHKLGLAIQLASDTPDSTLAMRVLCEHLEPLSMHERAALYALRFAEATDLLGAELFEKHRGRMCDFCAGDDVTALAAGIASNAIDDAEVVGAAGQRALALDTRDPHRVGSHALGALWKLARFDHANALVDIVVPEDPVASWELGAVAVRLQCGNASDAATRARALFTRVPALADAFRAPDGPRGAKLTGSGSLDARIAIDDWVPRLSAEQLAAVVEVAHR